MLRLITLLIIATLTAQATISSTTNRNNYTGNGGTSTYAYSFRVLDDDDLLVTVRNTSNSETTLTKTTHYTVTGVGNSSGTIVLVNGGFAWQDSDGDLLTNYVITIRRVRELKQSTDIRNQGRYYPSLHEDAFDHFVMLSQQLQDQVSRSAKLMETIDPANVDMTLPYPVASRAIGWNADGDGLANIADVGSVAFSAFGETLVDDASASAARTTLDVSQAINNMTAETTPASGDSVAIYDLSATADRKMTLANLMKVTNDLTADTSPAANDFVATYDASASAAKKVSVSALLTQGHYGQVINMGLASSQTTNAADSITITGAAAALGATNLLHVRLPNYSSPGLATVLSASADVKINLTGAHWGLGTLGDFSGVELRVYAINDNGTLKWGVSNKGGYRTITTALSSATATDINLQTEMLVNSTLTGTSPCVEVGYFLANFDDTGGAAEDLWAVSTSAGGLNVGIPVQDHTDWVSYTPTISWVAGIDSKPGKWRRVGDTMHVSITVVASGAVTAATLTANLPSGYLIDSGKVSGTNSDDFNVGEAIATDTGNNSYIAKVRWSSTSAVSLAYLDLNALFQPLTQAAPFTVANQDRVVMRFAVPIVGWSAN
jgi:hypothetical protein